MWYLCIAYALDVESQTVSKHILNFFFPYLKNTFHDFCCDITSGTSAYHPSNTSLIFRINFYEISIRSCCSTLCTVYLVHSPLLLYIFLCVVLLEIVLRYTVVYSHLIKFVGEKFFGFFFYLKCEIDFKKVIALILLIILRPVLLSPF